MPYDMGIAEGHIDLDLSKLKTAAASAVSELARIDREGDLAQSQMEALSATSGKTGGAFKQAEEKARLLSNQLKAASEKVTTYKSAIDGLNEIIKRNATEQQVLTEKINAAKAAQQHSEEQVKALATALRNAEKDTKSAETAVKSATKAYGEESDEVKKAAAAQETATNAQIDAQTAFNKASDAANKNKNTLLQLETRYATLGQETVDSKAKINEFATASNNARADVLKLSRELETAKDHFKNFTTAAGNIGTKLSPIGDKLSLLSVPLAGIGIASVKVGNDFESQMSRVKGISGTTGTEFEKLEQQAIDLGAKTSFSATQAADGMENLASAGFNATEIMSAMPGMLDLAAASGEDLAGSSEIAASTLRGFNLEAGEAGHVADVLAKNAATTNAAIKDTGLAMQYIAPVAENAGWSLESVSSAIGALADSGIKGESAGTMLRSMIVSLSDPSNEAAAAMEEMGFKAYDANGNMKPMSDIVGELSTATADYTNEQRDNAIATIFGTTAISGMNVLLKTGKTKLDDMTSGLENCDGAAKNMADTMLDNTKGSIEEMTGSLETAGITIQKTLAPHIKSAAEEVTKLTNKFSKLPPETQKTIIGFGGVVIAAGPAIKAIGGISTALSKLATPKGLFALVATAAITAGIAIAAGVKKAKDETIKADLAKRFGDISLSIEETEQVAEDLVKTDFVAKIDLITPEKEKLKTIEEDIKNTVETINKLSWKVSVGLTLTDDEKEQYKSAVNSFVQQSIAELEQKQYTASLTLSAVFGDSSNIVALSNSFYNGLNGDLTALGSELSNAVNNAFSDGVLSEEEALNIEQIRAKIQAVINKVSNSKFEGKLKRIEMKYGEALTPESFAQLEKEVCEEVQKQLDTSDMSFEDTIDELRLLYDNNIITEDAYDKACLDAQTIFDAQKTDFVLRGATFNLGTLGETFKTEIDSLAPTLQGYVDAQTSKLFGDGVSDGLIKAGAANAADIRILLDNMSMEFSNNFAEISPEVAAESKAYYEQLKPTQTMLQEITDKCHAAGDAVPQGVSERLTDIANIGALSGNMDAINYLLGNKLSTDPGFLKVLEAAGNVGDGIDKNVMRGIDNGKYGVTASTDDLVNSAREQLNNTLAGTAPAIEDAANKAIPSAAADGINNGQSVVNQSVTDMTNSAVSTMGLSAPTLAGASQSLAINGIGTPLSSGIGGVDVLTPTTAKGKEISDIINDPNYVLIGDNCGAGYFVPVVNGMNSVDLATPASIKATEASNAVINASANAGGSVQGSGGLLLSSFNSGISGVNTLVPAQLKGAESGLGLIGGANSQNGGVAGAGTRLTTSMNTAVGGIDTRGTGLRKGLDAGYGLTSGMDMQNTSVHNAGSGLAEQGVSGVNSVDSNSGYTWGSHLGSGLASGLDDMWESVSSAAYRLANAAARVLHFTRPDEGPLRDYEQWMPHFGTRYAYLLEKQKGKLKTAALSVADGITGALAMSTKAGINLDVGEFNTSNWSGSLAIKSAENIIDYERLAKSIAKELRSVTLSTDVTLTNNLTTTVELDHEIIGRKTEPIISRMMAKNSRLSR